MTAGTVLEGSRTSLRLWLRAIYLHAESYAITATRLSQVLGVTYKTAWLMGHKLRHALGTADASQPLSGLVRINTGLYIRTMIPGFRQKSEDQSLLVGASVNEEGDPLHIKIKRVSDEHRRFYSILPTGVRAFISENVAPGTSDLICITQPGSPDRIKPLVQIKIEACHWLKAGFWGGIGPKHLQAYLNQFCFNWNTKFRERAAFIELLRLSATMRTVIYPVLIGTRLATAPAFRPSRLRYNTLEQTG
ncbi:MAG: hypothetical protein JWR03_3198 [Cohnella sp.]|nr:hypothetical protein [Cohnella sp.]